MLNFICKFLFMLCFIFGRSASSKIRPSQLECLASHPERSNHHIFRRTVVGNGPGLPTQANEFPYMAALGYRKSGSESATYYCGGVLISKRFVLTSAVCADNGDTQPEFVRLGGVNLKDKNIRDIKIKRTFTHPSYDTDLSYNDIALLELEKDSDKTVACLWDKHDLPNTNVTAIGYGRPIFEPQISENVSKAKLKEINNKKCGTYYKSYEEALPNGVINTQICFEDPVTLHDTCNGDSGGPVIMELTTDKLIDYVVGITSYGLGCYGGPGIYTRVSAYIDWIEGIVWPLKTN